MPSPSLPHIVASSVEHCATLQCIESLEKQGLCTSTLVPVDATGCVDAAAMAAAVQPSTVLVTLMHSNNETGALQPVAEVAQALQALAHPHVNFHVDASQSLGKVPVGVAGVQFMTVAGHKLYAPQGTGALFSSEPTARTALPPYFQGGGQEAGLRPGTEAIPGAAALGAAAALAGDFLARGARQATQQLTSSLTQGVLTSFATEVAAAVASGKLPMSAVAPPIVHGPPLDSRLPNTLSIAFPGALAGDIQAALEGRLSISAGAACHSDVAGAAVSHVLAAMGVPRRAALGTVRLSLGKYTSQAEVAAAAKALARAVVHALQLASGGGHDAPAAAAPPVEQPPAAAAASGTVAGEDCSLECRRLYMQDTMLMTATTRVVAVGTPRESGIVFRSEDVLGTATLRRAVAPDTLAPRAPHPLDGATAAGAMQQDAQVLLAAPPTPKDVPGSDCVGVVLLDACVFHPQGGGQPADSGWIVASSGAVFRVLTARSVDTPLSEGSRTVALYGEWRPPLAAGETPPDLSLGDADAAAKAFHASHTGTGSEDAPSFCAGEAVQCWVDAAGRVAAARLHSAGHLLDLAMRNLKQGLKPGRGYHFEDGPWVEYEGGVPAEERASLVESLNTEMARLIAADEDTRVEAVQATDTDTLQTMGVCEQDVLSAGYSPEDSVRVVCVGGLGNGCMCGGTHVPSTAMLGEVTVTKVKVKKGSTKISYTVQGIGKGCK